MAEQVTAVTTDGLIEALGVDIDSELLVLALTHRSYAYEHGGIPNNERLEFLGDSVLGRAVTAMLYREHPDLDEGELAKRRAGLVSTVALAEIARTIGLGRYLLLGKGEELTGGRDKSSILADATEALIGAAYLSAGSEPAEALVLRLVEPLLDSPERLGAALDPKTTLQEIASRRGVGLPVYAIEASGPDHARRFTATVTVGTLVTATGSGTSKKQAEMVAALEACTALTRPAKG
ncbi:ribonuclease III [Herbiconiux sp. L3-i23]|uniref:ribonuclease III n=1 Tax=Herbiconiux sp. L3-i23 TaxID=2905871 RepID=UPI002063A735|nr:ribonuclease III [Herbiconiux sp. L3-i23]BDI21861.1 ribonuclease 3 [Herbiconiux sp. L3-i23]